MEQACCVSPSGLDIASFNLNCQLHQHGWRFWLIYLSLCLSTSITALDIVSSNFCDWSLFIRIRPRLALVFSLQLFSLYSHPCMYSLRVSPSELLSFRTNSEHIGFRFHSSTSPMWFFRRSKPCRNRSKASSRQAFADSMHLLWKILLVLCAIGLISVGFQRDIDLHTKTDIRWDMVDEKKTNVWTGSSDETTEEKEHVANV
ncbi:hypothetical protein C8J56DRAFT_141008 [Mycena floridula]|nr:hypothetical protein C8J56DRAFT_141008 [Mycena floridula]